MDALDLHALSPVEYEEGYARQIQKRTSNRLAMHVSGTNRALARDGSCRKDGRDWTTDAVDGTLTVVRQIKSKSLLMCISFSVARWQIRGQSRDVADGQICRDKGMPS